MTRPIRTTGSSPAPISEHGVPGEAILIETQAQNTGENVSLTRELLTAHGIAVSSALVICRPYQQRRAYATFKTMWPEIDVTCASRPLPLTDYIATIGDPGFVIDMIVGDTQRVIEYPRAGFAEEEEVPRTVHEAYLRLVRQGFTSRLVGRPT
ncbi:MAG: YdcF family protein [Acidimicrobiaceae bacterium]|nr:YdcF family protein [Acidimicrobiaceae bacterium]